MIVVHINPAGVETVYFQADSELAGRSFYGRLATGSQGTESTS